MKRRLACAALLGAWAATAFAMGRVPPGRPAAEGAMEWKGQSCAESDAKAELISDAKSWKALWLEAFGDSKPVPEVDFTQNVAAAVFIGTKRTGGYSVQFFEPVADGGKTVIGYSVKSPGQGMFVIQAFTTPYAIRLYPKPTSPAELQSK